MTSLATHDQNVCPPVSVLAVSVVVPAFNAAATIAETLESLLAQTHPHWEAIVVDDGSTDQTADIAGTFAARDSRIRLVKRSNGGESAARNTGITQARHAWLLFLDSDDWIAPSHLERMTAELATHPELDAVHCGYARVAGDGTHVPEKYKPPSGEMFRVLARRAAFPVHTCIVRKSLVEDAGGFDTSLQKSPDWDLWQRIARTGARFGAIREVLAYYRMQPNSASLAARLMLRDGLRVLCQGHAPDPRVRNPHPAYAQGMPREQMRDQQYYLLSWCAGLMIGRGEDPRTLFDLIDGNEAVELYPDAIAQCVFDSAPLSSCQSSRAWETLWPALENTIDEFFTALEAHVRSPDLATRAMLRFKQMLLANSPAWSAAVDDFQRRQSVLTEDRDNWRRLAEDRAETIVGTSGSIDRLKQEKELAEEARNNWQRLADERQTAVENLSQSVERLEHDKTVAAEEREKWQQLANERQTAVESLTESVQRLKHEHGILNEDRASCERLANERQTVIESLSKLVQRLEHDQTILAEDRASWQRLANEREKMAGCLRQEIGLLTTERNALQYSPEQQTGELLLNRLHLKRPVMALAAGAGIIGHRLETARLAAERSLPHRANELRVLATICSNFPIYSQTFVYQELNQLIRQGFAMRLIYSKLDPRSNLSTQFSHLWPLKRRLRLNRGVHERDFAYYRARMPDKVQTLVEKLCESSGLSTQALLGHDNFLQAFSYTRMAEAWRPHYLHSYFFYDRSLMSLVAGWMLDIPRGVSCYADHILQDYELKVVPLHLELCDIVIATSQRIKQELLALAPHADPDRILVKANGIDTEAFPVVRRTEPAENAPFRVVSVCRIEPKKGLLDLVEAVHLLRERGVPIEAHIVGAADDWSEASRDYKRQVDQRISERNLWGTVHLEGQQNHDGISRFLGLAHLFVAPFVETESGDKDGIPTAVLEGMATGLPVVATDAGSIPEVIDDGHDGLLTPQRDPVALAAAMEALLRDFDRRKRFGQNAAAKVRTDFDALNCEKTFHHRIHEVLQSRDRQPEGMPSV